MIEFDYKCDFDGNGAHVEVVMWRRRWDRVNRTDGMGGTEETEGRDALPRCYVARDDTR